MLDERPEACDSPARPAWARGGSRQTRRFSVGRLAAVFAALHLGLAPDAPGAEPAAPPAAPGSRDHASSQDDRDPPPRWHLPRKRQRDPLTHDDPPPDDRDWNPLAGPGRRLKGFLRDEGIVLDLDTAFYDQWASKTLEGDHNLATFTWLAIGDWRLPLHARAHELGTSYIGWTFEGSPGFDHSTDDQTISGNVGSLSGLNGNVVPDNAAVDELFWKQVSPDEKWILLAGRVDQSGYFDTNRIANNAYRQFFAFALENNLSIPFPTYDGLGPLLRFNVRPDLYLMASAGTSESDNPWAPWRSIDANDWVQLFPCSIPPRTTRTTPWSSWARGSSCGSQVRERQQERGKQGVRPEEGRGHRPAAGSVKTVARLPVARLVELGDDQVQDHVTISVK